MNNKISLERRGLYEASSDWAYDQYQSQTLWLRRTLLGLMVLALLLAVSIITNLILIPFKEKVPYLYAFDHATGEVTKIGELEKSQLSSNWEIARYFLIQYVIHYESYHFDNVDYPYQMVWAQSSDEVKKQYEKQVNSTNPNSPYKVYAKNKYVTVDVISVNRLNDNTVDLKFKKTLHDRAMNSEQVLYKEAIVKWQFSNAETTQKMLDRDPLGFKVTYYQVSQVNIENNP